MNLIEAAIQKGENPDLLLRTLASNFPEALGPITDRLIKRKSYDLALSLIELQRGLGVGCQGLGDGPSGGDGISQVGGDVSMPVLLRKTTPSYTAVALQKKGQGVVLVRGIVRRNGRVDTLSVVHGLGHGLEENAMREIASNWKFWPGMRNGQAVDVWATIEVTFNLK